MMLMDMLSGTQETMQRSAQTIEHSSRRELLQDPSSNHAQLQVQLRDLLSQQLQYFNADLKDELKSRIQSVAELLQTRGEHGQSSKGDNGIDLALVRQELQAVAIALSQQQREQSAETVTEVTSAVRSELEVVANKMARQSDLPVIVEGVARLESNIEKVLTAVEHAAEQRPGTGAARRAAGESRG